VLFRSKSRASDVFALGVSIQFLLSASKSALVTAGMLVPLMTLTEKMINNDPSERILAKDAQHDPSFQAGGAACQAVDLSKPPSYWACRGTYEWHRSKYMEEEVMKMIKTTTCQKCLKYGLATNVRILKVSRVENKVHWKSFSGRRAELAEQNRGTLSRVAERNINVPEVVLDDKTNEIFLWHGLPAENVPMVANAGLDERIANCKGLYGAGIYLTDHWCKALQYSRAGNCSIRHKKCGEKFRCNCVGPKRVLICRALMGEIYYVKPTDQLKGQRRPPERPGAGPGMVYDSVIAKPNVANFHDQEHYEMVLFDRKSVYPEWIVELEWDLKPAWRGHR